MVATGGNLFFWDNDIGSTSDSIYVFPTISTMYQVQAIANGCYGAPDTINIIVNPSPVVQIIAGPVTCSGALLELIASGNATNYNWTGGYSASSTAIELIPQINTDYILTGFLNSCSATDSFRIIEFLNPKAIFDFNIDTCSAMLIANNQSSGANQYFWSFDNQTSTLPDPIFEINNFQNEKKLALILNPNTSCADTAEIFIDMSALANDQLVIPNIFTPNNDNSNDWFIVKSKFNCDPIIIYVYNRWGELLFQQESASIAWDGKYKNKEVTEGVYYYLIEHQNNIVKGTVTLFR
jgi:gliding motility-associated-like protein